MISFLINQELRQESDLSPNMTVLQYLRKKVQKTGTKEGCGSGDCGACTVVIGEVVDGQLQYRSINSCLTFVSSLHGKQLITVEDLQHNNKLHPTQQAMVDFHGSQCGFCTPGFIMSMFALSKNKPAANKNDVMESLAGNLCRCTGYRPIVDAALSLASDAPLMDQFVELEKSTIARLQTLQEQPASLSHGKLTAYLPRSVNELAEIYSANPNAKLVAGGTDLALEVTQFHREIETLINLTYIEDMKVCEESEDALQIGANVAISDAYKLLTHHYTDFGELLHRFASLQIRNQGTLGGNIGNASPIGDAPPLLIALNAQVKLRRGKQSRVMPIEDYFISYKVTAQQESEFIEQVIIPKPKTNETFRAYKLSKRLDDDISAVCGAFNIQIEDNKVVSARIAFGGMAATPKRATRCENALLGKEWTEANVKEAMQEIHNDFEPLSDFRASKEYRSITAANMLRRFYIEQNHQSNQIETRVTSYV